MEIAVLITLTPPTLTLSAATVSEVFHAWKGKLQGDEHLICGMNPPSMYSSVVSLKYLE
jgi:hypothetical protein